MPQRTIQQHSQDAHAAGQVLEGSGRGPAARASTHLAGEIKHTKPPVHLSRKSGLVFLHHAGGDVQAEGGEGGRMEGRLRGGMGTRAGHGGLSRPQAPGSSRRNHSAPAAPPSRALDNDRAALGWPFKPSRTHPRYLKPGCSFSTSSSRRGIQTWQRGSGWGWGWVGATHGGERQGCEEARDEGPPAAEASRPGSRGGEGRKQAWGPGAGRVRAGDDGRAGGGPPAE